MKFSLLAAKEVVKMITSAAVSGENFINKKIFPFHCFSHVSQNSATVETNIVDCRHDDVIKWKHFPRYWPFVKGIHRWGHRCISLIKASDADLWCFLWPAPEQTAEQTIETPVNLRRHRAHYDVTIMVSPKWSLIHGSRSSLIETWPEEQRDI